ncbi:MAG: hypothetical protein JJ902_04215 [Roseibium sp.]|nr:hypothetical protein [Roseibium sp.]
MIDPKKLTDEELELCAMEYRSRDLDKPRCPNCGGVIKAWHVHICDDAGGANIPMESEAAKQLCRL